MAILCNLKNIHLSFGTKQLFKNAELTIFEGDQVGLLGPNGKGKSSLFNILSEKLNPDISTPPFTFDKKKNDYSVFLVPQEPPLHENDNIALKNYIYRFYPKIQEVKSKLDQLDHDISLNPEEKLINEQKELFDQLDHLEAWDITQNFESYLKFFGINDLEKKMVDLSGGEQKKVLIALGLSAKTKLILWDEPTNHLDMETIQLFENELQNSQQTFILITHDRYLLGKTTNKIFHIQHGTINTFKGSYQDYLELLAKEEEDRLTLLSRLKNSLRRETDWMRQGIKARGTRSKKRVENFNELSNKIKEIRAQERKTLEISIAHSQRKTKSLIQVKDISFSYPNQESLFENLSLTLKKGDKVGILGANGVGKSTLIKILSKQLIVSKGNIKFAEDLKVQIFSQKREELDLNKSPFDILGNGSDHVILPNGSQKHVIGYFQQFLFHKNEVHRPLSTFSGGEKNRLQMAINLLKDGDLWFFDEPTNDLDLETLQILERTLTDFKGALILISHDRSFLANVTNKIWVLEDKKIDSFEVGYEQVEGHLQSLALEKSLKTYFQEESKSSQESNVCEKQNTKQHEQVENSESLEKVRSLIEDKESLIEKIGQMIANLGQTKMLSPETSKKIVQLIEKQSSEENILLELYEKLDILEKNEE